MVLKYMEEKGHIHINEHDNSVFVRATEKQYFRSEYTEKPLELASRIAQEDFVLLRSKADEYEDHGEEYVQRATLKDTFHIVVAACVCFSFGNVRSRIGKPLGQVHKDVHGYEQSLKSPMDKLISRLQHERPVCRTNWEFRWSGNLIAHHVGKIKERSDAMSKFTSSSTEEFRFHSIDERPNAMELLKENGVGESLFLKVEYQTLIKLSKNSEFTLFSIRTFNEQLCRIASHGIAGAELARNIRAMPDKFAVYKGLSRQPEREWILQYLDSLS